MNRSEQAAYKWLQSKGYSEIMIDHRGTPDFTTSSGGFEVKRAYGNVIIFTEGQREKILTAKAQVLVFRNGGQEPVGILSANELMQPIAKGFRIKVLHPSINVSIDPELWKKVKIRAIASGVKVEELVETALRQLLERPVGT